MALISFVFSFYNEEQILPLLIGRIREVMLKEPDDFELIFVNDASTDHSAQKIQTLAQGKSKGKIVLVNMSRKFGVEEGFLAGIQTAQGDAVILMYADMQDPPELVREMLKLWREGAEVVHTVRRRRIKEHPLKMAAAFFAYRLITRLADIPIPLDAGEFKLLSRRVAQHLLALPEAEPYLRGLIPWIGYRQNYVDYDMQPRPLGRSKVPLFGKKAWTVFLSGMVSFSDWPVLGILSLGVMGILSSSILAIILALGQSLGARSIGLLFLLFLWATLMVALGIVGLYVLRIYKNTRGRPRYIIKEVVKF
jgi:polyisoprenyl-phosphate glycosyltransferase